MKRESFRHVGQALTIAEGLDTSLDLFLHSRMHPIQNAWSQPVINPNLFPLFAIISKHIPHSTLLDASRSSWGKLFISLVFCSHIFRCWLAKRLLWGCREFELQCGQGRPWASWQYSPYLHDPLMWYLHSTMSSKALVLWEYWQEDPLLHAPLKWKIQGGAWWLLLFRGWFIVPKKVPKEGTRNWRAHSLRCNDTAGVRKGCQYVVWLL